MAGDGGWLIGTVSCGFPFTRRTPSMDAHFREYLAAVLAMQEIYGERAEDFPTEFHGEVETQADLQNGQSAVVSGHW